MSVVPRELTGVESRTPPRLEIPPTPARLAAHEGLTGRGVTIAFLDSGFTPHPDLTEPDDRIREYRDVTGEDAPLAPAGEPEGWRWHGTQTAVSAAGNGFLSGGVYRGLAPAAQVVLVKVGRDGRIAEEDIARGLEWVLASAERLSIRVLSISLGGDVDAPLAESRVNQLAEEAVRRGIVVVVAAGNSGCAERHNPVPPATSPSVITVGGYDDGARLSGAKALACGSWGFSADGVVKPEVLAPSLRVAAPLVVGSALDREAEALTRLADTPDASLKRVTAQLAAEKRVEERLAFARISEVKDHVRARLWERKVVARHYQHVDGTSFAAPIVASLSAQLLELRPALTPAAVKHVLVATADRIQGAPSTRQGFGVLNASRAVSFARKDKHLEADSAGHPPCVESGRLVFAFHADLAERVELYGDFRGQMAVVGALGRDADGLWRLRIESPLPGRYRYKFVVDGARWVEDPTHGLKEDDGFGGFNSILHLRWDVR